MLSRRIAKSTRLALVPDSLESRLLFAADGDGLASNAPALNSFPGAPANLYLDFNGNRDFRPSVPPASDVYDIDGDITRFSPLERQYMREIWTVVADAFSPFNVNVTTVDPGPVDNAPGKTLNVLIGGPPRGASGFGAVGAFNQIANFVEAYGYAPMGLSQVVVHEAGHGFGLHHQSKFIDNQLAFEYRSEPGNVGPVMGAGSIGRAIWSDGRNPFGILQDDMAIIAGAENGFGYRTDDHGNSPAAATAIPLGAGNAGGSVGGVVHYHTDQDWFTFNWPGGPLAITTEGGPHGPLFDPHLQLSNASGTVLADAVGEQIWKMIRTNLPAGTYRLKVSPRVYTDSLGTRAYGNVGQYTLRIRPGAFAEPQVSYFAEPQVVGAGAVTTIEVEDFDRGGEGVSYSTQSQGYIRALYRGNEGVFINEETAEGYFASGLVAGDWIEYTIDVPQAGTFDLLSRMRGLEAGARMHVEIEGANVTGSVGMPPAQGRPRYTAALGRVSLPAGRHVLRLSADVNSTSLDAVGDFSWFRFVPVTGQHPYAGTPISLDPTGPVTLQAEDFDLGGQGVAYNDLTPTSNTGGAYRPSEGVDVKRIGASSTEFRLSDAAAGEWLEYSIDVPAAGAYRFDFRVGSPAAGGAFHAEVDGVNVTGAIAVPNTGGYDAMQMVTVPAVQLAAGRHVLRLSLDANAGTTGAAGGFDWIRIAPPSTVVDPVHLSAVADAYVRDGSYANQNFGSSPELHLKRSETAGSTREIYIKFDLASVPSVRSAVLRLSGLIHSATEAPEVGVSPVYGSQPWAENTITWNNRPVPGVADLANATVSGSTAKVYEWDVTSFLAEEKAAGRNVVTLVLRARTFANPYLIFSSDEASSAGLRPELVVTPSTGATPPPQLVVSAPAEWTVPEGQTRTFAVRLTSRPGTDVVVQVAKTAGDGSNVDVFVSPASLTFTPANWDLPQTVTLTVGQDADALNTRTPFNVSVPLMSAVAPVLFDVIEQDDDVVNPGTPVTLRAAADAYVRDGSYAGQNFGGASELQLKKSGTGSNREIVLRFDLSTLATVGAAKLRLFGRIDSSTERPGVAVYGATSNLGWTEAGVSWNTRPGTGTAAALATTTVATGVQKWYEWDVTTFVAAQRAAGATSVTLVLRSLTTTAPHLIFASDEATANRPELVVDTTAVPPPPPPGPVMLRSVADAYVRDGTSSGINFGSATELQVKKSGTGSNRETYFKFDLTTLTSVSTAKLRVFGRIDSSTEQPTVGLFAASGTGWAENTITWDTRPPALATALATTTVATSTAKWYEWDVTAYLQQQKAAGAPFVTLALRSLTTTTPHMIFTSDEGSTNRPELAVTP